MNRSDPRSPGSQTDGFIAVAVLWILGALAALVSIYTLYVVNTAAAISVHDDRVRAEGLVAAAVELTAYRLTASFPSAPSTGRFSFRMDQANVEVAFRSEAARIDLNAAPRQLLAGLFVVLGATPEAAASYADRIIAWRGSQLNAQASEAFAYKAARLPYPPRAGRFPNVNELSLVRDLPIDLVERALPLVTVYNGRPQINILEAAPEIIAALPGMTADRLADFLAQRTAAPLNAMALMQLLGPAQAYGTTQAAKASRLTIHVVFDNGHRTACEVVILIFEQDAEPYAVLTRRDDVDGQTIN